MSKVREDPTTRLILIEGDPGIPSGLTSNALAGLSFRTARDLVDALNESKMIGTASLKGAVSVRDNLFRNIPVSRLRNNMERATRNSGRDLNELYKQSRIDLRAIIKEWQEGSKTLEETRLESAEAFRAAYETARKIGRRASGLAEAGGDSKVLHAEETWFRSAVREELKYWNSFLDRVEEGRETKINERIDGYVRSIRFMYESARIQAMPDNVLLYWMGPKKDDPTICEGCAYLMEHSPYPKDMIPAVPRDGSTQCFSRCRHRIVVRLAESRDDVQARKQVLRSKKSMVEDLKRLKKVRRVRKSSAKGRARNPFRGETLPSRRRR